MDPGALLSDGRRYRYHGDRTMVEADAAAEFVRAFAAARQSTPNPATRAALTDAHARLLGRAKGAVDEGTLRAFASDAARCVEDLEDGALPTALAALHWEDLWLAFRARRGDPRSVAEFERCCIDPLRPTIGRVNAAESFVDEVRQRVREKLMVAAPGKSAKLGRYRGRGELQTWVRVVAAREAITTLRAESRRGEVDDDLLALEASTTGPELGAVKAQYRESFAQAFRAAITKLSAGQRNVLRLHYVHGLTIDDLAKLLKVHRSNAARRIAKARNDLLSATRQRLQIELRLGRAEFDNLMRLIVSRIDLSLERHLAD